MCIRDRDNGAVGFTDKGCAYEHPRRQSQPAAPPVCAACAVVLVVALGGLVFVPETSALSGEGAEVLNKEAKNATPKDLSLIPL